MSLFAFLILGLVAGVIAKFVTPGEQTGGWFITMVLGVAGALLGGWLGSFFFGVGLENFWSFQTWIVAVIGSVILLLLDALINGRKRRG